MAQVDRLGRLARPPRLDRDRGWSLDFSASRRIGATSGAVALTIAAAIAPATTLAGYDPAVRRELDVQHDRLHGRHGLVGRGLHRQGRRRRRHRHRGQPGRRALTAPGKVVYGPDLSLESQAPNLTNLDTNGHGTFMAGLSPAERAPLGLPRHGSRRADRVAQGRRRRRRHRRQPGHRGDRLGRPASQRQRPEHPGHQPVVRHELGAGLPGRPARLRRRAGLEGRHRRRRRGRQLRLPEPHGQRPGPGRPGLSTRISSPSARRTRWARSRQRDDKVPAFSPWPKRGATRGVDFVAPGRAHPGPSGPELVHRRQPSRRAALGIGYFRGSGTSESAAIVSGAAALVLQKHPEATPDQVKTFLVTTAQDLVAKAQAIGGGELQIDLAASLLGMSGANQQWALLERNRQSRAVARHRPPHPRRRRAQRRAGHLRAAIRLGRDGGPRGGAATAGRAAPGTATAGPGTAGPATPGPATRGRGNSWSGNSWSGTAGPATAGRGNSWSGNSWSGNSWSGNSWSGNSWSGDCWATGAWD